MNKEQIISEFFKKGNLLTVDAIPIIEKDPEAFLKMKLPTIVKANDLKQEWKILRNITSKKTEITKEDFVKFYNSKYEKMRNIIVQRVPKDYVSINKLDSTRSEVHVIGIVKDIREKDSKKIIELEDTTGSIPIIFDDVEDAELDDVIAVRAIAGGKVLFGKQIIYPDIPLRQPTVGSGKGCFVSDLHLDVASVKDVEKFFEWFSKQSIPYLFVAGVTGNMAALEKYVDRYCYMKTVFVIPDDYPSIPVNFKSSKIISLGNPAMIDIGVKILLTHKADKTMLKKRYLQKTKTILEEDYLVMEDVPDIVHSGRSNDASVVNYKSVTMVSSGSMLADFRPIVIDFATRDIVKEKVK